MIPEPLRIPQPILDDMVAHCQRDAPFEACGLLGGIGQVVSSIHPLINLSASPTRYDGDPKQAIEANRWLRDRGAGILAIYHSHPDHPAIPSKADLALNYWGETPRIIVSLLGDMPDVRVWRLDKNDFEELPWERSDEIAPPTES